MAKDNNKNQYARFRVSQENKETIHSRAEKAGLNDSEYMRTVCLSDKKVIFLEEGAAIAKSYCDLYNHLDYCIKHHHFTDEDAVKLLDAIEENSTLLFALTEKLTDIQEEEE